MDLAPGTILHERYRIMRLLGQGGMGAVYLAYDLALDHEVAVKINHSLNPQSANQFIAEARLLAGMRHPSLPRVIDYFIDATGQFLVMDYISGEDLKTLVEQVGAMPVEQVMAWAGQLGSALSYLHHQSPPVFHRDVKPANLRLSPENEVILVDFGIAKAADAAQATAAGAAGYTPGYAPPEQYGAGRSGPYTDQYAMAATLYHLLTGQKPVDAVQRALGSANQPPAQAVNPLVPANVSLAIERALSLRPEDRFNHIDEFLRALHDVDYQATVPLAAAGQALPQVEQPAVPPANPPPSKPAARPVPWIWVTGAALGMMVLVLGVLLARPVGGLFAAQPVALTVTLAPREPATDEATPSPPATSTPVTGLITAQPSYTSTLAPSQTPSPNPIPTAALPSPTPTLALVGKSRALAFVSDRGDGKTLQIWTMKVALNSQGLAAAADLTQLTFDPGDKQHPVWSPDGHKLLYSAQGGRGTPGEEYGLDLFVLDLAQPGTPPLNLTHRPGDDTDPAWSLDGKWIAFTNNGREDKIRMIDLMNADGSNLHRLSVDLEEFEPAWSPDGQWLVFVALVRENRILYRRGQSDGFATSEFFDFKAMSGRTGQVDDPAWSPDGTRIAYVKLETPAEGRLMSMDAATRGDTIVPLTLPGMDRHPAWSPDAQWLAFSSRRDGNSEIYLMRSAGQEKPFNLTNSPARDLWPAWQPG